MSTFIYYVLTIMVGATFGYLMFLAVGLPYYFISTAIRQHRLRRRLGLVYRHGAWDVCTTRFATLPK